MTFQFFQDMALTWRTLRLTGHTKPTIAVILSTNFAGTKIRADFTITAQLRNTRLPIKL